MAALDIGGYAGKILRVNLSQGELTYEEWDEATLRSCLGGTGLGAKVLYEEVPPGVAWNDPQNRLIIASGPLGGTRVRGSGTFSVVSKGPLTEGATATQANGYLGAYMRFSGFDGIIVEGASPQPVYLYLHDGQAELRDASSIWGKDTWDTEDAIKRELGLREQLASVFSAGPAGENLVRFAGIVGDRGHVAAHNGVGAVLGAKKLKAIVATRGRGSVPVKDKQRLGAVAEDLFNQAKNFPGFDIYNWGTLSILTTTATAGGWLPIKNYTTNTFAIEPEKFDKFRAEYIRGNFEPKPHPCWACSMHHCHILKIREGPYAGYVAEEPEYEGLAGWGPVIGQTDVAAAIYLANEVDRLGMDTNEASWVVAWVMECFERGILTREDTDGLVMTWGNVEAARGLLDRIVRRQGLGDLLAEGVMRAAQRIGGDAVNCAINTLKGTSPRGHDHRLRWDEMFDTCVSSSGTIETSGFVHPEALAVLGLAGPPKPFSPDEVATFVAKSKGSMQFEDSLGTCRFCTRSHIPLLCQAVSAVTGWDLAPQEAVAIGRRAVNRFRAFNLRHGITADKDAPSPRYGSAPVDGPAAGTSILPHWDSMRRLYYELMGWDSESGKPLPETLQALGLEALIADLW